MLGILCAENGRANLPLIVLASLFSAGGVRVPYHSGNPAKCPAAEQLVAINELQLERGKFPVALVLSRLVLGPPGVVRLRASARR